MSRAPLALHALAALASWLFIEPPVEAAEVQVAVAANFARPIGPIAERFEHDTGHHLVVSTGATGALLAQVEHGAPFEVFLAADRASPERLERDGYAVAGTRFAYAVGTLVLWSPIPGYVDAAGAVLKRAPFRHLAVANPALAPYGAAAIETLTALGLLEPLRDKIVQGESIAQAYQFVATGSAEVGFVALSQVIDPDAPATGSRWVVPASLHAPIEQDAVLLRKGAGNAAARALCDYLKGEKARGLMSAFGYEAPASPARR
jgi:molybdate transport system substrate-binding protein